MISPNIGDRVEVTLMNEKWGVGIITNASISDHGGSYLYPVFQIKSDNDDMIWVPAICIEKV